MFIHLFKRFCLLVCLFALGGAKPALWWLVFNTLFSHLVVSHIIHHFISTPRATCVQCDRDLHCFEGGQAVRPLLTSLYRTGPLRVLQSVPIQSSVHEPGSWKRGYDL